MPKIPFNIRRSGRLYFSRRVRLHNDKDIHAVVALMICDGQAAREQSAIVAAKFGRVCRAVNAYFVWNETLDADVIRGIFESELRHCLANLVSEFHNPARNPAALVHKHCAKTSAYDLAQRPRQITALTEDHRRKLSDAGRDENVIEDVAMELDIFCGNHSVRDEMLALVAEGLGLEPTDAVIGRLKKVHLQAHAEPHRLAAHFMDEDVQSAFNQEATLMTKRRKNGALLPFARTQDAPPLRHITFTRSTKRQTDLQSAKRGTWLRFDRGGAVHGWTARSGDRRFNDRSLAPTGGWLYCATLLSRRSATFMSRNRS